MKKIMMLFFSFFLSACATYKPPTAIEIQYAYYGTYPDDYMDMSRNFIKDILIDPGSAEFSYWRGPSKGWYADDTGHYFGYRVCVQVNAKNRMGGYTGRKQFYLLIQDNRVLVARGGDNSEWEAVRLCQDVTFYDPASIKDEKSTGTPWPK